MIWFALRRWRISIGIVLLLTGVLFFLTLHTGFDYENETATFNRLDCADALANYGETPSQLAEYGYTGPPITQRLENECSVLTTQTSWGSHAANFFEGLLLVVPMSLAIVLAAPLVAEEYRRKTHRVLWTQSVSRVRWFALTFTMILIVSLTLLIPFFTLTPWHENVFASQFNGAMAPWQFQVSGIVPVAFVLIAASLAVLLGVLIRFSLPAMMAAATLLGFAPWGAEALRFRVFAPVTTVEPYATFLNSALNGGILSGPGVPRSLQGAFLLNSGWAPGNRTVLPSTPAYPSCFNAAFANGVAKLPTKSQVLECLHSGGWHLLLVNEPASRFWAMQIAESGLLIALAVLCVGLSLWLIKRLGR